MSLWKKKADEAQAAVESGKRLECAPDKSQRSGGKNTPTPKRREAEAKNRRPLVPDNRKEAKERQRQARNQALDQQRAALQGHGDMKHLPLRDRGELRKYARDYIDSRWTLAEFLLPAMILALVPQFFVQKMPPIYQYLPIVIIYSLLILTIVEILYVRYQILSKWRLRHGKTAEERGIGMYISGRMFMVRRMRSPVAMVKRGDHPCDPK